VVLAVKGSHVSHEKDLLISYTAWAHKESGHGRSISLSQYH